MGLTADQALQKERCELEDIAIKAIQSETQRKDCKKVNRVLVSCGDSFRQPIICVIEVPDVNQDLHRAIKDTRNDNYVGKYKAFFKKM